MKTIQKGLYEAYERVSGKAYFEDGFNDGVKFAQQWISINEELPQNQDLVLVKTNLNSICTAYLHGLKSGFITYGEDAFIEFGYITHWRPIELI